MEVLEKIEEEIISPDGTSEDIERIPISLVKMALDSGATPVQIVSTITTALEKVGKLYEEMEYFMAELLICGQKAKNGIDYLMPFLMNKKEVVQGLVVFGSVKGDVHDIGKTIVSTFLMGAGFVVKDLGVEVSPETFVKSIKENQPDILAMSTLLTSCIEQMRFTIDKLKEEGLRDSVKVIVGGRPVTQDHADKMGADAFAFYPMDAVQRCKELIGRK